MPTLRRLLTYLRPYAGRMVLAAALLSVSGAMMAAAVSVLKPLVNEVLLSGGAPAVEEPLAEAAPADLSQPDLVDRVVDWIPVESISAWARENAFVQVPLVLFLVFVVRGVLLYFGLYLTVKTGSLVIRDLRSDLHARVTHQSLDFYQDHNTGEIITRILGDVARLQSVASNSLSYVLQASGRIPLLLVTAFVHEWRVSLVLLVAVPLVSFPVIRLGRKLRRAATASQVGMAIVANRITESVGGVKVVQGFGMEQYEIDRFRHALQNMLRADLKAGRAMSLSPAISELIASGIGCSLFYFAGKAIVHDALDPGDFAVVVFALGLLLASVRRLNSQYAELQVAMSASARVFSMMDVAREIDDRPDAIALPSFEREIRFEQLDFSYGDIPALRGIDLTVTRGETVALVGSSGSGKSTLANLLPRFYDPTRGRVSIDGLDIRDCTLSSLRSQIGLVTQETVLFDDTVRNNIAYGRADLDDDRVRDAARAAYAADFIEALPAGYDSMLGERGSRLSMGQRQRITIARALIKDPPILILDEATSALDAESEAAVQRALEQLMRGRTSIVIAHRLATIRNADRIVVLDAGRIVEEGSHEELIDRGGVYARLHDLQFRESVS